jgi:hypothetical protein
LRAPDISLQAEASGEAPEAKHVHAIWDAKVRGKTGMLSKKRVSDGEFARFIMVKEWLDATNRLAPVEIAHFDTYPTDNSAMTIHV